MYPSLPNQWSEVHVQQFFIAFKEITNNKWVAKKQQLCNSLDEDNLQIKFERVWKLILKRVLLANE
jgi:hypothetical protein